MSEEQGLPGQRAFEMAGQIADVGLASINFFIIICAVFVGWLLSDKSVISTPPRSRLRLCLALGYLASAGSIAVAATSLLDRATAALRLASLNAKDAGLPSDHLLFVIYAHDRGIAISETLTLNIPAVAFALTILTVLWIILQYHPESHRRECDEPSAEVQ